MKREPSIHITKSQFRELWNSMGDQVSEAFLDKFFLKARQYALDHRSLISGNKVIQKQAVRRTSSSIGDANLLADIIYSTRIKLKHIGVTKIKQTDMQWAAIKELVPVVNEFCSRYGFEPREGYIEFVSTGLKLMSQAKRVNYNFCANWLHQRVNWIMDVYEAEKEVNSDDSKECTKELYGYYTKEILDRIGISNQYDTNPQEYVWFVRARKLSDEIGIDYETFVNAQFYALEFCNGIPKIEDLAGDKARQRVINYMAKFNIVARQATSNVNWDDFKK